MAASFALPRAGGEQLIEGGAGERRALALQQLGAQLLVAHHARPAQHLGRAERRRVGNLVAHRLLECGKLQEQGAVERRLARRRAGRQQVQAAVHLAAVQPGGEDLAQGRLHHAQLLADAEVEVQVARIDRAQLQVEHAPSRVTHLHGISRHAVDHLAHPARGLPSRGKNERIKSVY
jgi:hypothetical protein